MRPSHGWTPRSSPPTAHSSSTIRPSVALVTTASLTATKRRSPCSTSIVDSSTTSYSPAKTRSSPAQDDRDVDLSVAPVRGGDAVLRGLLGRHDEAHAGGLGDRLEPRQRR